MFQSDDIIETTVKLWLNEKDMDFYQLGTAKLILEYEKCLSFCKDCVEKWWDDSSITHNFSLYASQTYFLTTLI
jgi:hypothetical protein